MQQLFDQTRTAALRQGLTDYAGSSTNDEAALQTEFGNVAGARKSAELALRLAPDSFDSQAGAAMVFAMIGDLSRADTLAKHAAAKSPNNLLLNNVSLATIRAAIEMQQKNFSGAVEQLRSTVLYEFADGGSAPTAYSAYCRGLAHLGRWPDRCSLDCANKRRWLLDWRFALRSGVLLQIAPGVGGQVNPQIPIGQSQFHDVARQVINHPSHDFCEVHAELLAGESSLPASRFGHVLGARNRLDGIKAAPRDQNLGMPEIPGLALQIQAGRTCRHRGLGISG